MCLAVYVGTDAPLDTTEWRPGESVLVVQELTEREQTVRARFGKQEVRYLGSHTQCSCGFEYGEDATLGIGPVGSGPEDDARGRRSVEALRELLERLTAGETVELFACWEGDQDRPPERELDVTPAHFGGEWFRFPERVLYRVRRGG